MAGTVFPIAVESVEAAIDPNNKLTFLIDWELTLKCNLDCAYCGPCHDNSKPHPPRDECLTTIDFMYKYVDLYMEHKAPWSRHVALNVYGGESLFHPDIVEILEQVKQRYEPYKDRWSLTITTTTNAVVSNKQLSKIINLIDEFTVSFHSVASPSQQQQVKDNLLLIKNSGKRLKCVIPMHPGADEFKNCLETIDFCQKNQIKYLPKQLDERSSVWNYNTKQIQWFNGYYQKKTFGADKKDILNNNCDTNLSEVGRACCGGRQFAVNQNYKERLVYVNNKFADWYCSVNWFFMHIKQTTNEVFVNKDCQMNFDGGVGPIGSLTDVNTILNNLSNKLANNTLPTIQCKKEVCLCGLCAPKSQTEEGYQQLMKKYKL